VKPSSVAELTNNALKHLKEHGKKTAVNDVYFVVYPNLPHGYLWVTADGIECVVKVASRMDATTPVTTPVV
jgi:hypothetical protein